MVFWDMLKRLVGSGKPNEWDFGNVAILEKPVDVVDEQALKAKAILDSPSTTNNPNINYNFSGTEKELVELNCFRNGKWINFEWASIKNGKLTIHWCDDEDMVNAEIKVTHHEGYSEEEGKKPTIKRVLSWNEWLCRKWMHPESYEVPREVTILWQ
jgi:hypothetical protein